MSRWLKVVFNELIFPSFLVTDPISIRAYYCHPVMTRSFSPSLQSGMTICQWDKGESVVWWSRNLLEKTGPSTPPQPYGVELGCGHYNSNNHSGHRWGPHSNDVMRECWKEPRSFWSLQINPKLSILGLLLHMRV